jgi:hypothetical protein
MQQRGDIIGSHALSTPRQHWCSPLEQGECETVVIITLTNILRIRIRKIATSVRKRKRKIILSK